MKQMKKIVFV